MRLNNERRLVLLCSRGRLDATCREQIKKILAGHVDWKEVLFQAVTHRMLNLVYFQLKELGLLAAIEQEIRKLMEMSHRYVGIKNRLYVEELGKMADEFRKHGIKAVILKGVLLSSTIYPEIETRYFNDIDFLVKKQDISKIIHVLNSLGFVQGDYNEKTNSIDEASRKQKIFHQMSTHELQEFLKISDNPVVKLIEVDINHSILWVGNCPYNVNNEQLVDRAIEITVNGVKTYMLDYEDCLIQLCCHLYREATILHWIKDLKDLKIYKFADILIYAERYRDVIQWGKLLSYTKENNLNKIIYYVFHYVNLMYGDVIPNFVMKELEPENRDFLDEYGIEGSAPSKWKHDFFTRLFDTDRILEIYSAPDTNTSDFFAVRDRFAQSGEVK